jgi:hypothetical protein
MKKIAHICYQDLSIKSFPDLSKLIQNSHKHGNCFLIRNFEYESGIYTWSRSQLLQSDQLSSLTGVLRLRLRGAASAIFVAKVQHYRGRWHQLGGRYNYPVCHRQEKQNCNSTELRFVSIHEIVKVNIQEFLKGSPHSMENPM